MKFTDEPPTEPGLYWCHCRDAPVYTYAHPFVVEVTPWLKGSDRMDYIGPGRDLPEYRWGDRIEVPEVDA